MIHWNDINTADQLKKTPESLPLKTWASIVDNSPHSLNIYHGCFRGQPQDVGRTLQRPSAPKPCRKVVWPERLRVIEYKTIRKLTISHSRSFDNITSSHC